jgi:hypothetical protein
MKNHLPDSGRSAKVAASWVKAERDQSQVLTQITGLDQGEAERRRKGDATRWHAAPAADSIRTFSSSDCEAMERVTAVLLFARCAPNRRCLHYRYEFVDYCSPVSAASY